MTSYSGSMMASFVFRHQSANALREAKRLLEHFHSYLGEVPPTVELAKGFLGQFADRKPTTFARYVAVTKKFCEWYGELLDIRVRVPKTLPDYVEPGDIDNLVEIIKGRRTHKKKAARDALLVNLDRNTGLRRGELARLNVGDVDLTNKILIIRQGKGKKDRTLPLTNDLCRELGPLVIGRGKNESVFGLAASTISGKIKAWSDKAGVRLHTHSLRGNFDTTLDECGLSIRVIQELLSYSSLKNTERYTLLNARRLREAIDLLQQPKRTGRVIPPSNPADGIMPVVY